MSRRGERLYRGGKGTTPVEYKAAKGRPLIEVRTDEILGELGNQMIAEVERDILNYESMDYKSKSPTVKIGIHRGASFKYDPF